MFIKVKRFQQLEALILEAQAVNLSNQFDVVLTDFTTNTSGPNYQKFDVLIDSILDEQIANQQEFIKKFGEDQAANLINGYLGYCDNRLKAVTQKIITEYSSSNPDSEEIIKNQEALIVINSRIDKLTKIYEDLRTRIQNSQIIPGITQKIQAVTNTVTESWKSVIDGIGSTVKKAQADMANAVTDEEKQRFAKLTISKFNTLIILSKALPAQYQQGINSANDESNRNIKQVTGMDPNELSQTIKQTGEIVKRIAKLEITNWKTVDELESECKQIESQINSLAGTKAEPNIEEYTALLNTEANIIRKKLADKSLSVDKTKGIHFDFNIKLRLYEKTDLPVTGQQIADNSKIMKFRKGLASFISFFGVGAVKPMSPAEQAFADLGKAIHDTYAKVLNTSAKFIGKALGGKEGQLKADAVSRLFIPGPSVLDQKKVAEELGAGSAPGLSVQVPGSIGSMGPITPPTATTLGSGDNFSPKKKKSKSKSKILGFNEYLKENKF
jgi:hypothetical protein